MITTKCFICKNNDHEPFLSARDTLKVTDQVFSMVRCKKCGLIFLNPAPDPKEMEVFCPDGYRARRGDRVEGYYKDMMINLELRIFRRLMGKGGRLLDVGSGTGEVLYNAVKMGFDCYGVEISEEAAEYSVKNFGLKNVINSDFLSTSFPEGFFDIILFNHVLEHLYNPIENLEEAQRVLKEEGILVVQVPNIDSYQFRTFRDKWFGLSVPHHLYHFNPETVTLAIENAGFHVFKIIHYSIRNITPLSFSITGLNAYKINQKAKEGRSVLFQKLLIIFLNWLFLPLILLEGWLKRGGFITVFARKGHE